MFITFEGIDGCGKSSQMQLLRQVLEANGQDVVATHEPGGTPLAEEIRALILHSQTPLEPGAELLLFAAARAQHVAEVIAPALEAKKWVLCDRFADSTLAYQGGGLGLDDGMIRQLNAYAAAGRVPDLTILLDVTVALGAARLGSARRDRIEQRGDGFHQRVREAFLLIAAANPERLMVLDGSLSIAQIHHQILAALHLRGRLPWQK